MPPFPSFTTVTGHTKASRTAARPGCDSETSTQPAEPKIVNTLRKTVNGLCRIANPSVLSGRTYRIPSKVLAGSLPPACDNAPLIHLDPRRDFGKNPIRWADVRTSRFDHVNNMEWNPACSFCGSRTEGQLVRAGGRDYWICWECVERPAAVRQTVSACRG